MKKPPKAPPILTIEVRCAFAELVEISELIPRPDNPNDHSAEQIAIFAKVIATTGIRRAIVVSKQSGLMVTGHGLRLALMHLGLEQAPVDYQDFESAGIELAHVLADNRLAELSDINRAQLREHLSNLDTGALDMDATGFDYASLAAMMTAAPPKSAKVGKLWIKFAVPDNAFGREAMEILATVTKGLSLDLVTMTKGCEK